MTNLRDQAKDRPCQIRVPNVCCGDSQRVVGCHVRMIGISGAGFKSPDLHIAWGCDACHKVVDGHVKSEFNYEQRRLMLLEGMMRTQNILICEGVIKW